MSSIPAEIPNPARAGHRAGTSSRCDTDNSVDPSNPAATRFPDGTFQAAPGRGRLGRMLATQAGVELKLAFRNGEQVLLTVLIPLALLIGLTLLDVIPLPEPRVAMVAPGVFALAVLSTAFTGQAIALGFDRRYGVIRRLAATALPRWLLVAGRLAAVLGAVAVQLVLLSAVAVALGWRPELTGVGWGLLLVLLGCAAFGGLGILLGGALRAEIVLAVANVIWFALLLGGGIVLPAAQLPGTLEEIVRVLPSGALAEGLRDTLVTGHFPGLHPILVLLGWAVASAAVATRTVRLR